MSKSKSKSFVHYSAMITVILTLSKIMGYVRDMIITAIFGATRESDILRIATTIPNSLFSFLAAAIVTTFIPVFANVKDDKEEANKFFNNIVNIVIIICTVLVGLGIIMAPQLTKLFASGFKGEDFTRTVELTKVVMPSILFLGLSGLYTGYLQSYGVFLQPALTGISADIVVIIGVIVFRQYGIMAAIVATMVSSIAQVLVQRPFMKEYKYKPYIDLKDDNVKRMLVLAVPILISTAAGEINRMVGKNFASNLDPGSVVIVDLAGKLSSIINQVFVVSITTVLYPMFTDKFSKGDKEGFKDLFGKAVSIIITIVIPLIFGMAVLSKPLVKLLLERGKFDSSATEITSQCLKYLAFSALGYSLIDILNKVFFSMKNTTTPMINNISMIVLNIVLINVLVPGMGVNGLALANTLAVCIISAIMLVELKFKMKDLNYKKVGIVSLKVLASGIVMAVVVYLSYSYLGLIIKGSQTLALLIRVLIATVIGALVYSGMLILLKVEEFKTIISMKIKKGNA